MGKHSHDGGFFGRKRPTVGTPREVRGLRKLESVPRSGKSKEPRARLGEAKSRRTGPLEQAPQRLKAERDRRRNRYKKVALFSAVAVAVLAVVASAGAYAWLRQLENTMRPSVQDAELMASLEKTEPQKPYTVLLLGADKRNTEEPYRTDTMILAKVDPQQGQVWLLSIPRDTRVDVPGHGSVKINQAYTIGGPQGSIEAVRDLTGVAINHYMEMDFEGFAKAVDALGGVWLDVPVAIDDWDASSHSRNHRAAQIDAGYQLLDGEHALTFVRARHQFVDQDFSRMKNQQAFFKALADQIAKSQNIVKLPRVVSTVAPFIETDMSLIDMVRTAQALRDAGGESVSTATLVGEWRSPFVHVDEANMSALVEKMNAGISFESTKTPEPAASTEAAATRDPSEVTVTVRNGGGIAGCAKQASSILKARGYEVREVGNAKQFVYDKTLVVYKDDSASAAALAEVLPPGAKTVESRGMYSFDTDVLVVIGKDWDVAKVPVDPIRTN
jgi:LCP family protein required for cell wall assembly